MLLLVYGCSLTPPRPAWPDGLPLRSYFEARYAGDQYNRQYQSRAEYLQWVKRFYLGWGGIRGWLSIKKEILAGSDAPRKTMDEALDVLGRRIAGEWAKESDRRAIRNHTVQVWINAAREAVNRDDLDRLLSAVRVDVEALLDDSLEPSAINLQRYYPDIARSSSSFDDPFIDYE